MFTATLFIITIKGNNLDIHQLMTGKQNVIHLHNEISFSYKKE